MALAKNEKGWLLHFEGGNALKYPKNAIRGGAVEWARGTKTL